MSYFTASLTREEDEVRAELARQNAKWGQQDHPDCDPHDIPQVVRNEYAFRAERWKEINAQRAESQCGQKQPPTDGPCTAWDGVLLEEVYEALAEDDPDKLLAELLQVEAVARQWRMAIRRRLAAQEAL